MSAQSGHVNKRNEETASDGTVYIEVVVVDGTISIFGRVLVSLTVLYVLTLIVYICVRHRKQGGSACEYSEEDTDSNYTSVEHSYSDSEFYDRSITHTGSSYQSNADSPISRTKGTMSNSSFDKPFNKVYSEKNLLLQYQQSNSNKKRLESKRNFSKLLICDPTMMSESESLRAALNDENTMQ